MSEPNSQDIVAGRDRIGTFGALSFRNFRLWFLGQTLSLMGTWMQSVAQGWVVFQLTGSEFALGAISFAGTLPTLFLMLPGGAIGDRVNRRTLLLFTQATMMVLAFILAGLAAAPEGTLKVWHIAALAVGLGIANSFDAPTRQALAVEMVEDKRYLMNVIALNSTIFNMARVVGPAVGGLVLAALGAAWCFGLNGLSFVAVLIALLLMKLPAAPAVARHTTLGAQIAEGLRYVWHNKPVRAVVMMVGLSSLFAFSYAVLLPAYAADVLKVGAAGLGALNTAVGAGALAGSLLMASLGHFRRKSLLLAAGAVAFPGALLFFAHSTSMTLSLALLAVVGFAVVTQNAMANTIVQTLVPDELRGRVMAVYSLMFFGTAPFGSLQAGVLAQALGTGNAVFIDAAISLAAAIVILLLTPSLHKLEI